MASDGTARSTARGARREVLFFSILPDPVVAVHMTEFGRDLCRRLGLRAQPRPAAKLHISLLGFGVDGKPRDELIAAARLVGSAVTFPPFDVVFTGIAGFGGGAVVFCCSGGATAALTGLRDRLAYASEDIGLGLTGPSAFAPHLTVAYDRGAVAETMLDEPIRWPAHEFVLVSSEQGQGRHTHLARWALGARAGRDAAGTGD